MKVLLLHPEDVPWHGPWAETTWDLIVDLGFAGANTYEEWSSRCGAPVRTVHEWARDGRSYTSIREMLDFGRNRLVDRMGLDWWEMIGVVNYQELQALYLLQCLHEELGPEVSYYSTQTHSSTKVLSSIIGSAIPSFRPPLSRVRSVRRSLRSALKLSPKTVVEIAFDKWDPDYSARRYLTLSPRAKMKTPSVLLPSAYSNVTRLLLQYAVDLPERHFLLAATRASGTSSRLPANVSQTLLCAYAQPTSDSEEEENELRDRWTELANTVLSEVEALRWSRDSGVWHSFPEHLRTGLRLRNAWLALLQGESICGVLCGDDLNYYTRIPMILAANMGLNAVYCYHGALDGGLLFKQAYASQYLTKSEMEKSYMLRCSNIAGERISVGAPSSSLLLRGRRQRNDSGDIVFFSQPYEVLGGRTAEIYREILPRLCALGRRTQRRVVVKLHPFESLKARRKLLSSVLTMAEMSIIHVADHPLLDAELAEAWCGIGVDSSAAMDCCAARVPYFLCGWLDYSGFGYTQQLARFHAGRMLEAASELDCIPELVAAWNTSQEDVGPLHDCIDADVLDRLLFANNEAGVAQCAC